VPRADNLTTFICRLSRNLAALTSSIPKGLSRPVMGLLYLCFFHMYSVAWGKNRSTSQTIAYCGSILIKHVAGYSLHGQD
jgi:hypothetical protein